MEEVLIHIDKELSASKSIPKVRVSHGNDAEGGQLLPPAASEKLQSTSKSKKRSRADIES